MQYYLFQSLYLLQNNKGFKLISMDTKRNIIVTDMRYRMALAPVRALASEGFKVTGIEFASCSPKKALGAYSNCINDFHFLPDTDADFAEALIDLCRRKYNDAEEKPVLISVSRRSINIVQAHPEIAEVADYIVPETSAMQLADDKGKIRNVAAELGIPLPATVKGSDFSNLKDMANSISFPAMIKFRNGEGLGLKPADRYKTVCNAEELISAYEKMSATDADPIVQEFIEGRDIGVAVVMDKDFRMRDFICYESLQEYPVTGGPTCLCHTIDAPFLATYAEKLLQSIKFSGIAMLDFRGSIDKPLFLEINPRIWGSANLVNIADSKFFSAYVDAACGNSASEEVVGRFVKGRRMSFFPQHSAAFLASMRSKGPSFSGMCDYLKFLFDPSVKDGLGIPGDKRPFRRYILNLITRK